MKIGVCIKQVPAKDEPFTLQEQESWIDEEDLNFETCGPDDYALEAALELKDQQGAEVIAISLGPARVEEALRTALAKGADRAIHIVADEFYRLDPQQLAAALAGAAREEGFDLLLTGLQSDDHGFGQTGVILAHLLDVAHSSVVVEVGVDGESVKIKRELEGGWFQDATVPLPAVLTIQSGINKPRFTSFRGIIQAKKKEIREVPVTDALPADCAATQKTVRVYLPEKTKHTELIEGDPADQAATLVEKLKYEERIL